MNKNIQKIQGKTSRLFVSDLKWFFNPIRIAGKFLIPGIVIAVLLLLFSQTEDTKKFLFIKWLWISCAAIISMMIFLGREAPTLDKNRAKFMYFNKHFVVLSKLICEMLSFIIVYLTMSLTLMLTSTITDTDETWYISLVFSKMPFLMFFYCFIYFITTWITTFFSGKNLSGFIALLVGIAGIILLWLYVILSANFKGFKPWVKKSEDFIPWIPFLNFVVFMGPFPITPLLIAYSIIPTMYIVIFILSVWKFYAKNQKKHMVGG